MSEEKSVAVKTAEISEQVLNKVNKLAELGQLQLPKDYSAANALKGAMLILGDQVDKNKKPVLSVCTKPSVATSLLKMIVEGLSPLKKQCYFIPHGTELTFMRSYQGAIALAKRLGEVKDVVANVVYEGDKFAFSVNKDTGRKHITNHEQALENIDNTKIKGAYAVVIYANHTELEVMSIDEITQAWKQGYGYGKSKTHENFTQEMAKKTVISRACKAPINSSDDSNLMLIEDERPAATVTEDVEHEVAEETAKNQLTIESPEAPVEQDDRVEGADEAPADPVANEATETENDEAGF